MCYVTQPKQPMTPAPPTPIPDYEAPDSPGAAPLSPPEADSPLPPSAPQTPRQQHREEPISSSSLNSSYEPEPKRLRTASAEAERKEVEAGKGTGACIKYTQVCLTDKNLAFKKHRPFSDSWAKMTTFPSIKWRTMTRENLRRKSSIRCW